MENQAKFSTNVGAAWMARTICGSDSDLSFFFLLF